MKIFRDGVFNNYTEKTRDPKYIVGIKMDKQGLTGEYPYFGEIYSPEDLDNIIPISDTNIEEISDSVFTELRGLKFKYPILYDETLKMYTSKLQSKTIENALNTNKTQINILYNLWRDRLDKYEDYLNKTYVSLADGTTDGTTANNSVGKTTSDGTTTGTNTSNGTNTSESENHGTSSGTSDTTNDGTTSGTSKTTIDGTGTATGTSSGTTKGTSTSNGTSSNNGSTSSDTTSDSTSEGKETSMTQEMPEANGLSGMYSPGEGLNPGMLGTDYISSAAEGANNSKTHNNTNTKGTSSNTGTTTSDGTTTGESTGNTSNKTTNNSNTDGTTSGTSKNTMHTESAGKTDGTTSGKSTSTNNAESQGTSKNITDTTSDSTGTTTGKSHNEAEGRSKDLIALSMEMQTLNNRENLINYIVRTLKPCLSIEVGSFSLSAYYNDINDDIYDLEED